VGADVLDLLGAQVGPGRMSGLFGSIFEVEVGIDVKLGEYARFAFELGAKGRGLECG
jgi:hypothetical protein